jgi:hypothetical protein
LPITFWSSVAACALLAACGGEEVAMEASDDAVEAAVRVVQFLRGEAGFEALYLADTVVLRLAPEGGGAFIALERERLRDRATWAVPTGTGRSQSLVPPPTLTELSVRAGAHLNCLEYRLATRAPDLAGLPHVGTMLAPAGDATNCLQTWNLTLVFDPATRPPLLIAAVYDQWEW